MKQNLALLNADIAAELAKIDRLLVILGDVGSRVALTPAEVPFYDRAALGYFMLNFYNGCENIFASIARFFENDLAGHAWHADLIRRMTLRIEGYRPALLDDESYRVINEFRGFRHVYIHAYGQELDWERERYVLAKLPNAARLLKARVKIFLDEVASAFDEPR